MSKVSGVDAFVTVYKPIAGYKAVLLTWEEELEMYTPWNTSYFAYGTEEEASIDARGWAFAEGLPYVPMGGTPINNQSPEVLYPSEYN